MTGDSSAETTRPEGMVFPCEVEVKVFGKSAAGFEQLVKAVIESVVPASQLLQIRSRQSSKGKYQSLSCRVCANSKPEIDAVFMSLNAHPDVVMVI